MDSIVDTWCEQTESSLIEPEPGASQETNSGQRYRSCVENKVTSASSSRCFNCPVMMFPAELKERLENVFLDLTKKLDNPELARSITTFVESYESIQTDAELASSLSSFGQHL